jgi:CMP-N-acetylneuraminic acid synthetase
MAENKGMVLGVIPARGGSKGVQGKNIRPVNGKPLICYTIECGLNCPSIDRLIVSTDSREIATIAKDAGANVPFIRPAHLARDTTPMLPVLKHALCEAEKIYDCVVDVVVLIDPTAPLRTKEDVEGAVALFRQGGADTVISGSSAHRNPYFNMVSVNPDGYARLVIETDPPCGRRQDAPEVFDLNTVVWIFSRNAILNEKVRITKRTKLFLVPSERSIDLDNEFDFQLLDAILKKKD